MSKQGELHGPRLRSFTHLPPLSSASTSKRPLESAASPPASKVTKLASMFAPASSRESSSLFTWLPPLAGCMHGVYDSANFKGSTKVAAFDLDGTVIAPRSGNKFPKDKDDWKYWNGGVPKAIRDLHADGWVSRPSSCIYALTMKGQVRHLVHLEPGGQLSDSGQVRCEDASPRSRLEGPVPRLCCQVVQSVSQAGTWELGTLSCKLQRGN